MTVDAVERRAIESELGVAIFVVSAQLLLKFGIATTALVGSSMLISGELPVLRFFMFLLVVSRIYEPMAAGLINLAAMVAVRVNIKRTQEIEDYRVKTSAGMILRLFICAVHL